MAPTRTPPHNKTTRHTNQLATAALRQIAALAGAVKLWAEDTATRIGRAQ